MFGNDMFVFGDGVFLFGNDAHVHVGEGHGGAARVGVEAFGGWGAKPNGAERNLAERPRLVTRRANTINQLVVIGPVFADVVVWRWERWPGMAGGGLWS